MTAQWKTDHSFGLGGKPEQTLAEGERHNTVLLPMQHQERRVQMDNALIRMERVLHKPAYGHEGVSRSADVDRGCEWRIENKSADVTLRRKSRGHGSPERFAPQHDPFRGIPRGRKIVGRNRIANKPGFARVAA